MMIKYAIALAIALVLAVIVSRAFLPPRHLPGNRARHLRIRLHLRWGRLTALRRSSRIRPSLPLRYCHRLHVPLEEHLLVMAPPRTYKTVFLANVILRYPGPVIATTTKTTATVRMPVD